MGYPVSTFGDFNHVHRFDFVTREEAEFLLGEIREVVWNEQDRHEDGFVILNGDVDQSDLEVTARFVNVTELKDSEEGSEPIYRVANVDYREKLPRTKRHYL